MSSTMKTALLKENGVINIEQVEIPFIQDGEVLVKVSHIGICGSDYGRIWNNEARYYPIILGHEFSGEIVESKSSSYKVGTKVAIAPLVPCMKCEDCNNGNYSQCPNYSFIGSRRNGALAEYVAVPEVSLFPIGDLPLEKAAFLEPITVGLHGISLLSKPILTSKIAVLGVGSIGLLTVQSLLALGAKNITVIDIDDVKLNTAKQLGVTTIINSSSQDVPVKSFDIVIETAGNVFTTKSTLSLAGTRGEILFIGTPHSAIEFTFDEWELINRKELTLRGSWMNYSAPYPGKEWQDALDFLQQGKINTSYNVVETKLEQLPEILEKIHNREITDKIIVSF